MSEFFRKFSHRISIVVGTPWAFAVAFLMIIVWAAFGKYFDYSDTWELIINTATTIITFLMVFIIQNSQNRDMKSIHLKLDELIRVTKMARNDMMELENMSEMELEKFEREFIKLVREHKEQKKRKKNHQSP